MGGDHPDLALGLAARHLVDPHARGHVKVPNSVVLLGEAVPRQGKKSLIHAIQLVGTIADFNSEVAQVIGIGVIAVP